MKPKMMVRNARAPKGFWGNMMINAMNKGHKELSEWGLGFLPKKEYETGLDVGCGGGENVKRLVKLCRGKVYGMDISPLCVERSKVNCAKLLKTNKAEIREGSAENLPFENNSLSLVSAVETVYFWDNVSNCFREIFRALSNDGVFIIINEMTDRGDKTDYKKITETVKMNVYSVEELKTLVEDTGFVIKDIQTRDNWTCIVAVKEG